jgi:predicted AAA+ superfamily ATPase
MEDQTTRKREIKALINGAKDLRCKSLIIISWEEEATEEIDGLKIEIIPIWKWLLKT